MIDALQDLEGSVSIGDRTIMNLCFTDNIDGIAGKESKVVKVLESLASAAFGMEISSIKTKLMTIHSNVINADTRINAQELETLQNLKYLEAVVGDEGSKPAIMLRIVQSTEALTELKKIRNNRNNSLSSRSG